MALAVLKFGVCGYHPNFLAAHFSAAVTTTENRIKTDLATVLDVLMLGYLS